MAGLSNLRTWIVDQFDAERGRWMLWLPVALGLGIAVSFIPLPIHCGKRSAEYLLYRSDAGGAIGDLPGQSTRAAALARENGFFCSIPMSW